MISFREQVTASLAELSLDAETLRKLDREICCSAVVAMIGAGFTLRMAADALGLPVTTAQTWARKHQSFAGDIDEAREITRGWLLGELRLQLREGGKAAGQAANILANLNFPELRERKVEHSTAGGPDPDKARANLEAMLGRGK